MLCACRYEIKGGDEGEVATSDNIAYGTTMQESGNGGDVEGEIATSDNIAYGTTMQESGNGADAPENELDGEELTYEVIQ